MSIRSLLLVSTLVGLLGCAADKPATEVSSSGSSVEPPAAGGVASGAVAASSSPRAAAGSKLLGTLEGHEMYAATRARIAGVGLSEGPFGLSWSQVKALTALGSVSIDPSQCSTIAAVTIEETARPLVEKRCGTDFATFAKKVSAMKPEAQAREVATACKIDVPAADLPKLRAWGMLLSAVIGDQLQADAEHGPDEAKIAAKLVWLCAAEE